MKIKLSFEIAHKEIFEWAYITLATMGGAVIFGIIYWYVRFG